MHKYKKIRNGISLLLSFFLALSFFTLYAGAVIKNDYLPGNTWRRYLMASSYGSHVAQEAEQEMEKLLADRGIPVEAAGDLVSQEHLYAEYGYCNDDIRNGRNQQTGRRDIFEEQLREKLMEYLESQQAVITKNLEREVGNLVKEAGGIYDRHLNPSWLSAMAAYEAKAGKNMATAMAVAGAVAALCMILLWQMYHHKHRALRYVCYGAEASLVWSCILLVCLSRMGWLEQSGISSEAYRNMIAGIGRKGMQNGLLVLGMELLLTLMVALAMKYLKHKA